MARPVKVPLTSSACQGRLDIMTSDRRRGGRALSAVPIPKPPADSPAGLLATIYKSTYPEDDPTAAEQLDAIRGLREHLEEEEQQIVLGLRLGGTSWQAIGDLFGITRQAAHERFRAAATIDKLAGAVGKEAKP